MKTGNAYFNLLRQTSSSTLYNDHQLLWKLFNNEVNIKRDFIFRKDFRQGKPFYYVVSARKPVHMIEYFEIETKPYSPKIKNMEEYSFSLRVNPIVSKKIEGQKNSKHYDVVSHSKKEGQRKGYKGKELLDFIDMETKGWLIEKRAENAGFLIKHESLVVDMYTEHKFFQKKGKIPITICSLDFHGILTVFDAKKMQETLSNGIGKAKAFGCGLLLIKRL